jgi:hypothetical protein
MRFGSPDATASKVTLAPREREQAVPKRTAAGAHEHHDIEEEADGVK